MPGGSKYLSILVSVVALFGPISYLLYALYESGRLGYFGAPVDFIQLTSFGVLPVIETIHPGVILTVIVLTVLGGMKHATPRDQFRMASGAAGYVAGAIAVIATNNCVKWGFGGFTVICALILLFVNATSPEIGNKEPQASPIPISGAEEYQKYVHRWVFIVSAVVFFCFGYVAAGIKQAEKQIDYWVSDNRVALAIYGNLVLLAELNGNSVGPGFEVLETKSLPKPLILKAIGPLKTLARKKESDDGSSKK